MKWTLDPTESRPWPRPAMTKVRAVGAAVAALMATAPAPAQTGDDPVVVLVVGSRASLTTAQDIKRDKLEIVDSVVAEDIGKLPDFSLTDAIQRVTGVQVARDRGDGTNVAIRGLTQVETTLNGREIFTAWSGRNLDYADIPAEMLAGVDVYKTSSAHQLEGGVGGLVDLRTRRPFDFAGAQAAASVRQVQGDLVNQHKTQYSALLSNRWKTEGAGEFGALLSVSMQERAFREDQKTVAGPILTTFGGQQVVAPGGSNESTSAGTRKRNGASLALQWRPRRDFDLYAEGNFTELRTIQNSYQLFAGTGGATITNLALIPGTSNVQSIGWNNAGVYTAGAARDMIDRTTQLAVGGTWFGERTTIKADASYTKSHNDLLYTALILDGAKTSLSQDLSPKLPATTATGGNLLSLGSFTTANIWYSARPFDGELKALRLDLDRSIGGDFIDTVSTGVRVARRHATDAPGQTGITTTPVAAANAAGLVAANPYSNFLPGSTSIGNFLAGNADAVRGLGVYGLRQALGMNATVQTNNPMGTWDIDERTDALYAMATIRAADVPLDGNVGVRIVRTVESVSGYRGTAGAEVPNDSITRYIDRLPSANARYEVADRLYLRAAASKTLTRPDFNQIAPSLTLNNVQLTGTAGGNPDLHPVRSDNRDLAIERHFGKSSLVQLTLFTKKVDGFLVTRSAWETYDGIAYNVSRPYNAETAHVKGAEIGYQQFYDFLPGWLSGLGLQANYTYVDSSTRDAKLQQEVPLQNLSKNSLNLIGMYERGPVSARLAYNWRGKFLASVASPKNLPALPVYVRDYGWLDASLSYRVNDKLTLSIEGNNLLRTVRRSYYGDETRPADAWINDRQIVVAASLRY
jgi:TonB-dependent receptor